MRPVAMAALARDMVDDQVRTATITPTAARPPTRTGPPALSGSGGRTLREVASDIFRTRFLDDHRPADLLEDVGRGAEARQHAVPQSGGLVEVHDEVRAVR